TSPLQLGARRVVWPRGAVQVERCWSPVGDQQGLLNRIGRNVKHAQSSSAELVGVAVRAVEHRNSPSFGKPRNVRQFVGNAEGENQPRRFKYLTGCQFDREAAGLSRRSDGFLIDEGCSGIARNL